MPAYSPKLDLLVVPTVDWCGVFKRDDEPRFIAGQLYFGGSFTWDPVEKSRGWLTALKASTGEVPVEVSVEPADARGRDGDRRRLDVHR